MKFNFEAMDSIGVQVIDVVEAANEDEAKYKIRQMGYFITKICGNVKLTGKNCKFVSGEVTLPTYERYVTMRTFKLWMIALIAIGCMLTMVAISQGQEPALQDSGSSFFQEVVVKDGGNIRAFRRESPDCKLWGDWIEVPPFRSDQKARVFKPLVVNQTQTTKTMGIHVVKFINSRPRVSGHYNFSGNKNYDWKKFGGDKFGTWMIQLYPSKVKR